MNKLTKSNIVGFLHSQSIKNVKIVEITGFDKGHVSKIMSGKLEPTDNFIQLLNDYFKNKLNEEVVESNNSASVSIITEKKGVPYYDIDFSGGWSSEELFTTQQPSFFINNPDFYDADFACNLFGPSIAKTIPSGAIVGFKEIQDWKTYFPGGEFYGVVTKNDLRTVKIVKKIRGNDKNLLLIPDPISDHKDRFEEEEIPIDFIVAFYQVVAWAQFERLVM